MKNTPDLSADLVAPDISIRARAPSPRRLNRKVLLGAALLIGGVIAFALIAGLAQRDRPDGQANAATAAAGPPDTIKGAPAQYDAAALGGGKALEGDMLWGEHAPASENLEAPADPAWSARAIPAAGEDDDRAAVDPERLARRSPILFGGGRDGDAARDGDMAPVGARAGFLASQRGAESRLTERLAPPRSRYELLAGAIIPAALVTELNSDLPGRAIAQVTEHVYDSVTGNHLLIPQGARLLGTYDNAASYGDQRILLVWNRLVFPNGWSINLRGMEGVAPSGAAGLTDRTDRHFDRLAGAIGLSAVLSVVANEAEDGAANGSLTQSVGDAAAQEAARTGARIVDRELGVRPTMRIRAGAAVRVLVTRDIQLKPFHNDRFAP